MKQLLLAAGMLLAVGFCLESSAQNKVGSPVVGWRGDGSGIYPDANPPVQWQRVSKAVAALRIQAEPPAGEAPSGQPMSDGVIREWLVLGPVAAEKAPKGALADALLAEDQSGLQPAAGRQAAGAQWKAVKTDTAYIDFAAEFDTYGKNVAQSAYAAAWVHSPAGGNFIFRVMHTGTLHLWVNGKLTHKFDQTELNYTPQTVKLDKGWSRVLVRSTPQRSAENRPIVGTWYVNLVIEGAPDRAEYEEKNIAWRTALPAPDGFGGPIVVDGKIFLLSEPADLVCLDAATGRILWVRSNNYNELATDDERKAHADLFKEIEPLAARLKEVNDSFASDSPPKIEPIEGREEFKEKVGLERKLNALMQKVDDTRYSLPKGQDVGTSGLTPVSDGRRIWAWFATGVTCCYDLDGKLLWRRLDNEGSFFEHGYSTSPILADGKLIVFMNKMVAFDAERGDRLWTTGFDRKKEFWADRFHGTPAAATIGKTPVCVLPTGYVLRLSDGKILYGRGPGVSNYQQEIPSPVVMGNTLYRLSVANELFKTTLPAEASDPLKMDAVRKLKMNLDRYPTHYLPWHMCSPLIHDGLAYLLNNTGVLTVVDVETMEVVYERLLDLDHFQTAHEGAGRGISASPALAGGRIYLVGNTGVTLVIKPGRNYEQLARNRIESVFYRYWGVRHERFVACPAFDGKRMFLRGERFLYSLSDR